jgi:hypothetical protein
MEQTIFRNTPYWLNFLFAGLAFTAEINSSITGNGTVKYFEFITPDDFLHHIIGCEAVSDATADLVIELIEAPTITDGTIQVAPINMDRRKSKQAKTIFYSNPTAVSGGTVIKTSFLGGGKTMADSAYATTEILLKKATKYVIKVTSLGTGTTNFYIKNIFYESSN